MSIQHISEDILFADDTSVLVTDSGYDNFKQKANLALSCINKRFQANQLLLIIEKTNFVKFTFKYLLHAPFTIEYADKFIKETISIKFLVM
jgi:hypothetical protein